MRTLISVVVLTGAVTIRVPGQQAPATPVATVEAFDLALAGADTAAALRLLAPDVVVFESGGVEASREEYRHHHLSVDIEYASSVAKEVLSRRADESGDVAWVLTESRWTGTFRERAVDSRSAETMVLRRTAEGWRIVHIHWSSRRQ